MSPHSDPRVSMGLATGKIDQFESTFRAAARTVFEYRAVPISSVLLVSDGDRVAGDELSERIRWFLRVLGPDASWTTVCAEDFRSVPELLGLVEEHKPDLICTYRHLRSDSWKWPYTLGEYVDVLTQVTTTPVVVLPHPKAQREAEHAMERTARVMAITDHLTGDADLVNFALRFVDPGGTLWLTHVEDERVFDRYVDVIGRVPSIETNAAADLLHDRLLREPTDYIESCRDAIATANVSVRIEALVAMGHHLRTYQQLVDEHEVDLLVFNTKDDEQLAMHGVGYALANEMRQIPLLML